jgi:GTP cyclohydrolase IA
MSKPDLGAVEQACARLLAALWIEETPHTKDTARRMAKAFVNETLHGLYTPKPRVVGFPNGKGLDEVYVVGPVAVRSICAHHFVPIMGRAWLGVLPSNRVLGLSKFSRLTRWVMARPQVQEDATAMLADEIQAAIAPRGLAVVVKASHLCMTWRGVLEHETEMTTSVMRGTFRENGPLRAEFMSLLEV